MGHLHGARTPVSVMAVAATIVVGVALLAGCSGSQNETIGSGDVSLVFTNQGDTSTPMIVRYATGDRVITHRFTVLVGGKVTLKAPRRLTYDIEMRPECVEGAQIAPAGDGPRQDQVIDATRQ